MRRTYIILLLIMGCLSGPAAVLAQGTTPGSQSPPYEDATTSLGEPPTPRFFRLEADVSAAGISAVRLPRDPAWEAATKPAIRLEQIQVEAEPTENVVLPEQIQAEAEPVKNVALPVGSKVEELRHFLEQALDGVEPAVTPAR